MLMNEMFLLLKKKIIIFFKYFFAIFLSLNLCFLIFKSAVSKLKFTEY